MTEEWRPCPVPQVAAAYEVSSHGRLRRVLGGKGARAGHLLRPKSTGQYFGWMLTFGGYRKVHYVHELVALAFLGPRPPHAQINHKNLDKLDNRTENLEYVTQAENARHAARMGVGAKLGPAERDEVRRLYAAGVGPALLRKMFRVSRSTVFNVVRHKNYSVSSGPLPAIEQIGGRNG